MEFPIRINKYLREQGIGSRRDVDRLIEEGKVLINGKPAKPGMIVAETDRVQMRNYKPKQHIYLAYYKPRGLPTQTQKGLPSVISEWEKKGLFPIGRLDKESEGLMILTDDGSITEKILGLKDTFEKEYIVTVREELRQGIVAIFAKGMETESLGKLLPSKATLIDKYTLRVILREGKRHQIRVMLSDLGYTVTSLKRVRIGRLKLGDLRPGETYELDPEEATSLFFQ